MRVKSDAACFTCNKSRLISASSWSEYNAAISIASPVLRRTNFSLSPNPPALISVWSSWRSSLPISHQAPTRNAQRYVLFLALDIYFCHCLETAVAGLCMVTSSEWEETPLLSRSPDLIDTVFALDYLAHMLQQALTKVIFEIYMHKPTLTSGVGRLRLSKNQKLP